MKICKKLTIGCILLGCAGVAGADTAAELLEHYQNKTPVGDFPADLDLDQAAAIQSEWVTRLAGALGPEVGYKAGLTNPAVQQQFGVDHPLRGVLFEKMLLPDGAELPADFGAVPMSEGDLVVRVGDAAINQATTPMDALAALDAVMPFIELPDLMLAKGVKLDAAAITAINVGARYGVIGEPIALSASDEWRERLKNFRLQILDGEDNVLAEGTGANLLGDPLAVVLWLKDSLAIDGTSLKVGDLLSLGTVTRLMPVQPGTRIVARYSGLDPGGPVSIGVAFR